MSVRLQQEWLEPSWTFYIGVESTANSSKVTELLSERKLDLKAGSSDEVDDLIVADVAESRLFALRKYLARFLVRTGTTSMSIERTKSGRMLREH